jgi:diguanylate cyclase (GGDEF)-like protein/PAS domain S-box-containing protein
MSERKNSSKRNSLESSLRELQRTSELSSIVTQTHPLDDEGIEELVIRLGEELELTTAIALLVDSPPGAQAWTQRCVAGYGIGRASLEEITLPMPVLRNLLHEGPAVRPLAIHKRLGSVHAILSERRDPAEEAWLVPLRTNTHLHGVLLVAVHDRALTPEEHALLEALGHQAGRALDHAYTVRRLATSEERLQLAVDATHDGVFDWDIEKNTLHTTPQWRLLTGVKDRPGLGLEDWLHRIHPADRKEVQQGLDSHIRGETPRFEAEYRVVHEDDEVLWLHGRAIVILDNEGAPRRVVGSQCDITKRKHAELELQYLATHDLITDLPNRMMLLREGALALEAIPEGNHILAVLTVDAFSMVNDVVGYSGGDQLLCDLRDRLQPIIREQDTLARLQGDIFAIFHRDLPQSVNSEALWRRLTECLSRPFEYGGRHIHLSMSAGFSQFRGREPSVQNLLQDAHTALYHARRQGRESHELFRPGMRVQAIENWELMAELPSALLNSELSLVYQPIMNMKNGLISGFEALLRWNHPKRGNVPPGVFIPLAQDSGMIVAVGREVLRMAADQAHKWHAAEMPHLPLSVNLAPEQFSQGEIVQAIQEEIEAHDLPSGALKFEITEHTLMNPADDPSKAIQSIQDLGCEVVIDDFGTGYSSLNYLIKLGVNGLKLDRSFVMGLDRDPQQQRVVGAVIRLAHNLDLQVTAEGIEHDQDRIVLQALGCDRGQGFLFHRPMKPEAATALLAGSPGSALPDQRSGAA